MKAVVADRLFQTWVIYGPSGGGKTTVSATAPSPLVMDSNQGMLSIAGRPGFEKVRSEDIHSIADLDAAYSNCTGTGKRDWSKTFKTIVFDHFDDIQAIVLEELGDRAAERDSRRDIDAIEQREYGIMGNRLRRYVRKFKRVPMHKILICGEKQDHETGRLRPSLIGALGSQLPYLVDHTAYLRIGKNGARYLHLDSTDEFYAKTRAWWLSPEERRIRVPFNDTHFLAKLFARIVAGPKQ